GCIESGNGEAFSFLDDAAKRHRASFCPVVFSLEKDASAAEQLVSAALCFATKWKHDAFKSAFVFPTQFILDAKRDFYASKRVNIHGENLYLALIDTLTNIKCCPYTPFLIDNVQSVFPFLDRAVTGDFVHHKILSHVKNPKNIGQPLPHLETPHLHDAESFIAPPDSIFSLKDELLSYTIQDALDDAFSDEPELKRQMAPYLDLFYSLFSAESMLEPFWEFLVQEGLIESCLQPVFESYLDADKEGPVHLPSNPPLIRNNPFLDAVEIAIDLGGSSFGSNATTLFSHSSTPTPTSTLSPQKTSLLIHDWLYVSPASASPFTMHALEFRYDRFKNLLDFAGLTNPDVECVFESVVVCGGGGVEGLESGDEARNEEEVRVVPEDCTGLMTVRKIGEGVLRFDKGVEEENGNGDEVDEAEESEDEWPWETTSDDGDEYLFNLELC
ncbi:hypothetical protein HDU98_008861, partial [Podochytrium sp. JEL0797]